MLHYYLPCLKDRNTVFEVEWMLSYNTLLVIWYYLQQPCRTVSQQSCYLFENAQVLFVLQAAVTQQMKIGLSQAERV